MSRQRIAVSKIWGDESGEPCQMTIEEFDARIEASTNRMRLEPLVAEANILVLQRRIQRAEAKLARLQSVLADHNSGDSYSTPPGGD